MSQKKSELDQSPEYWQEYTNIQFTKHKLIKKYLDGWLPKLTSYHGRVLYFDTHSGRGAYATGESGSPLVAVKSLLNHHFKDRILDNSEIIYYFIERDQNNLTALKDEVTALGVLPKNIKIQCQEGESFKLLEELLDHLDKGKSKLAPSFVFIDPYGFKVPGKLLKRLMSHEGVELFINVIWRELDMGMRQREKLSDGLRATLNDIFDGANWEAIANDDDFDSRAQKTVNLFREITGAKWATFIRMLGDNHKTRYMLVHLTNHPSGRDLIKDCLWSA